MLSKINGIKERFSVIPVVCNLKIKNPGDQTFPRKKFKLDIICTGIVLMNSFFQPERYDKKKGCIRHHSLLSLFSL